MTDDWFEFKADEQKIEYFNLCVMFVLLFLHAFSVTEPQRWLQHSIMPVTHKRLQHWNYSKNPWFFWDLCPLHFWRGSRTEASVVGPLRSTCLWTSPRFRCSSPCLTFFNDFCLPNVSQPKNNNEPLESLLFHGNLEIKVFNINGTISMPDIQSTKTSLTVEIFNAVHQFNCLS